MGSDAATNEKFIRCYHTLNDNGISVGNRIHMEGDRHCTPFTFQNNCLGGQVTRPACECSEVYILGIYL